GAYRLRRCASRPQPDGPERPPVPWLPARQPVAWRAGYQRRGTAVRAGYQWRWRGGAEAPGRSRPHDPGRGAGTVRRPAPDAAAGTSAGAPVPRIAAG